LKTRIFKIGLVLTLLNSVRTYSQRMDLIDYSSKSEYTILVDFSRDIDSNRFWVYSHEAKKIIMSSKCSHGSGSGKSSYATSFSNNFNSHKSSLGRFRVSEKYCGRYGQSFRLDGLSSSNSNARARSIVIHSGDSMKTKWSWGCFSLPGENMKKLIKLNLSGSNLISYYK